MPKCKKIAVVCSKGPDTGGYKSVSELNDRMGAYWLDNLNRLSDIAPDLIVLPENSDRFTDQSFSAYIDYIGNGGGISHRLSEIAKKMNTGIAYTGIRVCESSNPLFFKNSIRLIDKAGNRLFTYDKNYVTIEENDLGVAYGNKQDIYDYNGTATAFAICFDLNFDDLLAKYRAQSPDLLVFSSYYHGGLKQEQWAYDLRCHMASAISGKTGRIISPLGRVLAHTTEYYDYAGADINTDCRVVHLDYNMDKIKQAKQKYKDNLTCYDPGKTGTVLLTSESLDTDISAILSEFEIETYDEYLARCITHRGERIQS